MSRGVYGNTRVAGFGDRVTGFVDELKLKKLAIEFDETCRGLAAQAKTRPDWQGYFTVSVEPVWKQWFTFHQTAGTSIDAASFEAWRHKLNVLRAGAESFGMKQPRSIVTVGLVGAGAVLLLGVVAVARRSS